VIIRGRVQGVGYRQFVQHRAVILKLEGWVRNLGDGSVEAEFSGPLADVERLLADMRQGPALARVDEVLVDDLPARPSGAAGAKANGIRRGFHIAYSE